MVRLAPHDVCSICLVYLTDYAKHGISSKVVYLTKHSKPMGSLQIMNTMSCKVKVNDRCVEVTYRGLFSLVQIFLNFLNELGEFILCYCKMSATWHKHLFLSNSDLLDPLQGSLKQQNTFTTRAAANVDVIVSYHG